MAGKDEIRAFFPVVIQVSEIEGAEELNKKLLKSIYEIKETVPNSKPPGWCCEVYTTIRTPYGLLEREDFKGFLAIAKEKVMTYARGLRYDVDKYPPKINECWVNVYSASNSQEVHRHPNSVFSGIYYVKAPKGCAPTLFHSEVSDVMLDPPVVERTPLNVQVQAIEAVEGRMVIFRSWVRHGVLPSPIDDDRVTISFNVTM